MKSGYLSDYFKGFATKKLSLVEVNRTISNQHEFNGAGKLKDLLGIESGRKYLESTFIYLSDDEVINAFGKLTWYDARENNPNRTEWRLYYPVNDVMDKASPGDILYLLRKHDDNFLVIIVKNNSTISSQLAWLFDVDNDNNESFNVRYEFTSDKKQIEYVSGIILDQIGIEFNFNKELNYLDEMLSRFNGRFPTTKDFSNYAKETLTSLDPIADPDRTLLDLITREEALFRILEKHFISETLKKGFYHDGEVDIDGFVSYSLSVQNRRKSRVGQALENHVEYILKENGLNYTRTPVTENKSKPDFLFPDIKAYCDKDYSTDMLTVLGVKSTCKDRWRQVLSEAERISNKHLLTLEPAISEFQTEEMKQKNLRLVLPKDIHETYRDNQKKWLLSIEDFIDIIKEKQKYYTVYY